VCCGVCVVGVKTEKETEEKKREKEKKWCWGGGGDTELVGREAPSRPRKIAVIGMPACWFRPRHARRFKIAMGGADVVGSRTLHAVSCLGRSTATRWCCRLPTAIDSTVAGVPHQARALHGPRRPWTREICKSGPIPQRAAPRKSTNSSVGQRAAWVMPPVPRDAARDGPSAFSRTKKKKKILPARCSCQGRVTPCPVLFVGVPPGEARRGGPRIRFSSRSS